MVNVNNTELQGDAHLLAVSGGKTVLIDAGYLAPAQKHLVPFLKKKRIRKIDLVFISHAHRDHYEGLKAIIEADIELGTVYFNIPNKKICDREIPWGCNYQQITEYHRMLASNDIKIEKALPGMSFDLGHGAEMKILYAFDGVNTPAGKTDINDMSLIISVEQHGQKLLFPGDINKKIGRYLAGKAKNLKADVLKVPHHGAESVAPDIFFKKVGATYALVPSTEKLWCSKRSARVRRWFQKNNVPVYLNGWNGNVRVEIRKSEIKIHSDKEYPYLCK